MILVIIFGLSFYCFGTENDIYIMFYSVEQKEFYKNYFTYKKIGFIDDINYIKLSMHDEIAKDIIGIEYLKIEIIRDNINNINTTRTFTGGPYKRKYFDIDITDGIILKEDDTEGRLRYDPLHPDAIKDGAKKDYVLYPKINLETEYRMLFESVQLYNSIVDYIHVNCIKIVVEKIPMNTLEEINHFIKLEKQIETYSKIMFDQILFIQSQLIRNNEEYNKFLEQWKKNERKFNLE
jgi:flagellar basal body rod protein FlgC